VKKFQEAIAKKRMEEALQSLKNQRKEDEETRV
jgi:hypothetical protein